MRLGNSKNGAIIVKVDKKYFRPAEVDILLGDYTKAKKQLNGHQLFLLIS